MTPQIPADKHGRRRHAGAGGRRAATKAAVPERQVTPAYFVVFDVLDEGAATTPPRGGVLEGANPNNLTMLG